MKKSLCSKFTQDHAVWGGGGLGVSAYTAAPAEPDKQKGNIHTQKFIIFLSSPV